MLLSIDFEFESVPFQIRLELRMVGICMGLDFGSVSTSVSVAVSTSFSVSFFKQMFNSGPVYVSVSVSSSAQIGFEQFAGFGLCAFRFT